MAMTERVLTVLRHINNAGWNMANDRVTDSRIHGLEALMDIREYIR